mgnify:CR=1 FL=1
MMVKWYSEDKCGLGFLTFVLQLRKTLENPQPGNLLERDSNLGPLNERQRRSGWCNLYVHSCTYWFSNGNSLLSCQEIVAGVFAFSTWDSCLVCVPTPTRHLASKWT